MSDRRETAAPPPGAADGVTPPVPASDTERVLLLECRLEQMRSALEAARDEADRARTKLADATAREAEHARRAWRLHEELSEARAEVALLHRRIEQSEALRAELAGHVFEAGGRDDADELRRLRTKMLAEDQRSVVLERTTERLRERVEELLATRETLLTRIAEWQLLIREDGPEALDLSEFLSDLRREIIDLEYRTTLGDARELRLRDVLAQAGIDPEAGPRVDVEADPGLDTELEADPGGDTERETTRWHAEREASPGESPAEPEGDAARASEPRPGVPVEAEVAPRIEPDTLPRPMVEPVHTGDLAPASNGRGPAPRPDSSPPPAGSSAPRPAGAWPLRAPRRLPGRRTPVPRSTRWSRPSYQRRPRAHGRNGS